LRDLYDAFGDESAGPQFVSYAVVLVAADKQAEANAILAQVKSRFGASADDQLHCRVLFSGQQRKKTAWARLDAADVFDLYSQLMREIHPLMIRRIVSLGKKSDFPASIPGAQWQHVDPKFIGPLPWSSGYDFRDKHIANLGAHGTMIPLSKWPNRVRRRMGDLPGQPYRGRFPGMAASAGLDGTKICHVGTWREDADAISQLDDEVPVRDYL
jgi:hypothetical protein